MLPSNARAGYKEAQKFDPIPADMYTVELTDLTEEKVETYNWKQGKTDAEQYEMIYNFQFVLLEGTQNNRPLRGLSVWSNFVPSYLYSGKKNGKNKLWKITEALLGRELAQAEYLTGLDANFLNGLIGRQCRVLVEHKTNKEGNIFANPVNWLKATVQLESLTSEEKEKAKPKKKQGQSISTQIEEPSDQTIQEGDPDYVGANEIPF